MKSDAEQEYLEVNGNGHQRSSCVEVLAGRKLPHGQESMGPQAVSSFPFKPPNQSDLI